METIIQKIAYRSGCGDWLAGGVRSLAKDIPGSEAFAIHVKGLEVPEQEPRAMKAWGLGWAVASRGADHLRAFPLAETTWSPQDAQRFFDNAQVSDPLAYSGKAKLVKWSEEISALCDSLIVCKFFLMAMAVPLELVCKALNTVCGGDWTEHELMQTGERMVNLERMFNVRRGLSRLDDRLPARFAEPLTNGPRQGETFVLENMLNEYYVARGWDTQSGIPRRETLKRLDLEWVLQ
jgi:aldehyde:ferredoxin oxidoreductase